jgi:hypothetical protein
MVQTEDSSYKVLAFAGSPEVCRIFVFSKAREEPSTPTSKTSGPTIVGDPEGGQFSAVHMILVAQHLSLP